MKRSRVSCTGDGCAFAILTEVCRWKKSSALAVRKFDRLKEERMTRETEIKLKVEDVKAFERKLKKLGAKTVGTGEGRVHEFNTIFDTPDGGLAKHGQLLRIRTETAGRKGKAGSAKRMVLTFKQPMVRGVSDEGARFKVREETETELTDSV